MSQQWQTFIIYLLSVDQQTTNNDEQQKQQQPTRWTSAKPIGLIQCNEVMGNVQMLNNHSFMIDEQQSQSANDSDTNSTRIQIVKCLDQEQQLTKTINELIRDENQSNIIHFGMEDKSQKMKMIGLKLNCVEANMDCGGWYVQLPCMVLLAASINVVYLDASGQHRQPSERISGSNEIHIKLNDECHAGILFDPNNFKSETPIIDLYIAGNRTDTHGSILVKRIVTIVDRKQIASIFYQKGPEQSTKQQQKTIDTCPIEKQEQTSHVAGTVLPALNADTGECLIYYKDKFRKKPVALVQGKIEQQQKQDVWLMQKNCCENNIDCSFKPTEIVKIPDSDLEIVVENGSEQAETTDNDQSSYRKDCQYILRHWSLLKVKFKGGQAWICNLNGECHLKLMPHGSILFGGYVALIKHHDHDNTMKLFSPGPTKLTKTQQKNPHEILVNNENCVVFIGDHFMFLTSGSTTSKQEKQQQQQQFKSIEEKCNCKNSCEMKNSSKK